MSYSKYSSVSSVCRALLICTIFPAIQLSTAFSDTFGSGSTQFDIEFVHIGNPGNPGDASNISFPTSGAVNYEYQISKHEISQQMVLIANSLGNLGITTSNWGSTRPATEVTWLEAAKFVNWLNTSQGYSPAYKIRDLLFIELPDLWLPSDPGYDPSNQYRNRDARYVLPSEDEWYKAAYFDASAGVYFDYPTGSNSWPTPVSSGTLPGTAVFWQSYSSDQRRLPLLVG